jgi:putative FmdB family regulatory protein
MPIYEYECRQCGEQFELLVLKTTVASCPACQSQELEQLISGFAVSSEAIRQSNIQAARRKYANSSNYKDQKIAEAEEIREHSPMPPPPPKKKGGS